MSDLDVRVGDAERAAVVDRLAAHFREGRLDAEELEERTAAANAARTRGDLVRLEADLPAPPRPVDLAAQRRRRRERIVSALAIPAFLWVIYAATDFGGFPWPIFPTAVFVLGLVTELGGGDHRRHHHGRSRHRHHPDLPPPPRPPERL
ncbi:DUF1707 SHOCT-like domain-containing protein [Conexibacter woesei]|uniref:DUF1707 SHOCT-like domain-containing protein n=1 Tax=Conexibacter woesei TaxID=191495 RepID=UPI0003F5EF8F|nr:DUF1707 domain-containing protein [Conexibacter woesei]